jgi:DnaJ-domain-containing protein 1
MMNSNLVRKLTPEEEEMARKKAELEHVETELAQRELELATLHGELHAFERQYQQVIGVRYLKLDRIDSQIEEYLAYLEEAKDFVPSESLKQLYRQIAKKIHPDLATNETERLRRQDLMSAVNQAYEDGDEERLLEILHQWESSPEAVQGNGIGAELVRTLRKIAQIRDRLTRIEEEFLAVQQTELYQIRSKTIEAEESGYDLLNEMAINLDDQIEAANQKLELLKEKLGY